MTILQWLLDTMKRLGQAGVDAPRRDALVLLEDVLSKDRSWVLARPEMKLDQKKLDSLEILIKRRISREPLAYIRGKAWFWGRFFAVSPAVMIPRPESESFIELLKEIRPKSIVDVGTGSGCLAITIKLELPATEVIAIDTSSKALKVAEQNAKAHGADIRFLHGSLLEPLQQKAPEAIAANLPYVAEGLITSPEITREPAEALFSGVDGLGHYRQLWQQVKDLPKKPQFILIESLKNQHKPLAKLALVAGYKLQKTEDLVQLFVVV